MRLIPKCQLSQSYTLLICVLCLLSLLHLLVLITPLLIYCTDEIRIIYLLEYCESLFQVFISLALFEEFPILEPVHTINDPVMLALLVFLLSLNDFKGFP